MKILTSRRLGIAALTIAILAACAPPTTTAPSAQDNMQVGEAVEVGESTPIAAETATETVCNCGIMDGTMTKQVELSHAAAHAVSWEVGGQVGVGGEVSLGAGVNIEGALSGAYGEEWESSRTRTVGFPLTAEPNTNVEYTIEWREFWQEGYIPVRTPTGPEQITYGYLIQIDGNIVGSRDLGCVQGCEAGEISESTPGMPSLPQGYRLYDDFATPGRFDADWRLDDANHICEMNVASSALSFACRNRTADDLLASLHPSSAPFWEPTGVAASVYVEKTGKAPRLITNWGCRESGEERAYHLGLDIGYVIVEEYHPQDGWRSVELGQAPVAPGQAHLLQIEQSPGGVAFYVDSQSVPLDVAPDWLDCLSMRDWAFDFLVWPDHSVEGQVEFVAFR